MKRACRNRHAYLAEDRVENYSVVLRGLPSEWHGRSGLRQVDIYMYTLPNACHREFTGRNRLRTALLQ